MDIISYAIKSSLADGQMFVDLQVFDNSTKQKKKVKIFNRSYCDESLPQDVKKNFKDIVNVHSILNQSPQKCKVNTQNGVITLVYEIIFPNGNKFCLEGHLQLEQISIPEIIEQVILGESVKNKFQKLQDDIKKIQQLVEGDSKINQQQLFKLSKQIVEDVEQLKQRYQQFKYWKKQQELKYKEIQQFFQLYKNQQKNSSKVGLNDQIMHVIEQKLNQQKQNFTDKFQKQAEKIEDLQSNGVRMKNSIDKLAQQNLQLKKVMKTLEETSKIALSKNQTLQSQIMQLTKANQKIIKFLKNLEGRLPEEVPSPKRQNKKPQPQNMFCEPPNRQNVLQPQQLINVLFGKQSMTSPKAQNKSMNPEKTFSVQQMQIHPNSGYSKQFIINNKTISYNGIVQEHTQLVGSLKISKQRLSFISVIKTKRNQIGFGVIDIKYINQRNSVKNNNCIMFYAANGALYDGGVFVSSENMGFQQGDKVKMRVNPIQGFIQFSIAGTVVCKHKSQKLKDVEIDWVPFVRLCDKGDTLKWTLQ